MKRLFILWITAVLLAACTASEPEAPAAAVPEVAASVTAAAVPATAPPVEEAPVEDSGASANVSPSDPANIAGFPAKNVDEAGIVRERDWKIGADDPLVTIIEYGDFQ
jgi:hypothetical protein